MKRKIVIEIETSADGKYCGKKAACLGYDPLHDLCCNFVDESENYIKLIKGNKGFRRCPACIKAEVR